MKDYGKRDRDVFLHRPRSWGLVIVLAAVILLAADYWIRRWL